MTVAFARQFMTLCVVKTVKPTPMPATRRESSEARVDSRDSVNKLNETDVLKSVSILS